MEDLKGALRVVASVAAIIALIVLFVDAKTFLSDNSWRDPSAIQIMQVYIEKFIAPALLTIGLAIAVYIGTRAGDGTARTWDSRAHRRGASTPATDGEDVAPGFCEHGKWRRECPYCNPSEAAEPEAEA